MKKYQSWADDLGLLKSGGSDFHGKMLIMVLNSELDAVNSIYRMNILKKLSPHPENKNSYSNMLNVFAGMSLRFASYSMDPFTIN